MNTFLIFGIYFYAFAIIAIIWGAIFYYKAKQRNTNKINELCEDYIKSKSSLSMLEYAYRNYEEDKDIAKLTAYIERVVRADED